MRLLWYVLGSVRRLPYTLLLRSGCLFLYYYLLVGATTTNNFQSNIGAINIYIIHFVAPSAGFISVVLLCWIHICTPLMGSVRVVSKALLNRVLVQ